MSHRDGPGEAGPSADPGRPLPGVGADLQEAPVLRLGEGPDLPGRSPARFDIQCGGTGQPPASQDAEDGVSGAHPRDDQRSDRVGHVSRCPRSLPRANDEGPPPHKETLSPGGDAKVSAFRGEMSPGQGGTTHQRALDDARCA